MTCPYRNVQLESAVYTKNAASEKSKASSALASRRLSRELALSLRKGPSRLRPQCQDRMPTDSSSSQRAQPYVLMVPVALAVRLAVIPFTYHEWMDPFVLEHWAFGLIARSIASGHGFGSPFAETGSSALLPPVYSYLLAGIFKVFGIETQRLNTRGPIVEQRVLSTNLHSSFPSGAAGFRRARRQMGGMGMGILSLWHLLRSGLGMVDVPGHARTHLLVSVCLASRRLLAQARLDSFRRALRRRRAHRTGRHGRPSAAWNLDSLPPLPARAPVEGPDDRRSARR